VDILDSLNRWGGLIGLTGLMYPLALFAWNKLAPWFKDALAVLGTNRRTMNRILQIQRDVEWFNGVLADRTEVYATVTRSALNVAISVICCLGCSLAATASAVTGLQEDVQAIITERQPAAHSATLLVAAGMVGILALYFTGYYLIKCLITAQYLSTKRIHARLAFLTDTLSILEKYMKSAKNSMRNTTLVSSHKPINKH
jgi:hypothetical protein